MNTQPTLTIMITEAVLCANNNGEDCTISYVQKYLETNYKVTNLKNIVREINQLIDNDSIFYYIDENMTFFLFEATYVASNEKKNLKICY